MRMIVAGGGIGGLAVAIALAQRAIEVVVLEQRAAPDELGAGIGLFANGTRIISALGLDDHLLPVRQPQVAFQLLDGTSGRVFSEFELGDLHQRRFGAPAYNLHRGDLHAALLKVARSMQSVAIHFGCNLVDITTVTGTITAVCENGFEVSGDGLIGADGIHSAVRSKIVGADEARYSGEVVWRALVPCRQLATDVATKHGRIWTGSDRHFLQFPIRAGEVLNVGGFVADATRSSESWTEPGDKSDFLKAYGGFHRNVLEIIGAADHCFVQAIYEREIPSKWWKGRTVLIGDACHAMPPHMGQGAGMALEDAIVLAKEIARRPTDLNTAFEQYQSKREDRVRRLLNEVRANAAIFRITSPLKRFLVHRAMWLTSKLDPAAPQRRFSWVYGYNPLGHD